MSLCYNVPVSLLESFPDENLIVRSREPSELFAAAQKIPRDYLCYLQLLSPERDAGPLLKLNEPALIDVVVDEPRDFALLYNHEDLLAAHPVRVTAAVKPGFIKTVRLAMSLGLPVKLELVQPDKSLVDELLGLLDHYLHRTTVSQPVEFFHGLLMSFYWEAETTLWEIQEEDPSLHVYVTDSGGTAISRRMPIIFDPAGPNDFLTEFKGKLLYERSECSVCPFFKNCAGYFKLPDIQYECADIRELLAAIRDAASELRKDYEKCVQAEGGHTHET